MYSQNTELLAEWQADAVGVNCATSQHHMYGIGNGGRVITGWFKLPPEKPHD